MEADPTVDIRELHSWLIVIGEGLPDTGVAVDRDRIGHVEHAGLRNDVVDVVFEAELRCMHANNCETGLGVPRRLGPDVGEGAGAS
jgi:hypothetical protein